MSEDDRHLDTFARGVAILEMKFVPVTVIKDFAEAHGWALGDPNGRSLTRFVEAFMRRFPMWQEVPHGKGIELSPSAHAKMAWAAFRAKNTPA